jgi:DNA-binding NarL/FixJ family response regulator
VAIAEVWTDDPAGFNLPTMATPYSVIVADDSEAVRHAICRVAEQGSSFRVVGQAGDYAELLKLVDQSLPDVVVMDIHMPNRDRGTADAIKGHMREACLIAVSIWTDEETTALAQSYGAYRLLDKATLGLTLRPTIEECFRNKERSRPV